MFNNEYSYIYINKFSLPIIIINIYKKNYNTGLYLIFAPIIQIIDFKPTKQVYPPIEKHKKTSPQSI